MACCKKRRPTSRAVTHYDLSDDLIGLKPHPRVVEARHQAARAADRKRQGQTPRPPGFGRSGFADL